MTFGSTPLDGSTTPIPMSSAVPDGTNTPLAVEGGPAKTTGGNNLAPVAVYLYDGYNVVEGTTTDAAGVNTIIGQLKQIKANTGTINIAQINGQAATNITLGQSTRVNSVPVTLASDQGDILVKPDTTVITGSASALNATVIPPTDLSGYASLSIQATSIGAGCVVTFQCSNTNTGPWQNLTMNRTDTNSPASDGNATSTTGVIFSAPVLFRYFQAVLTASTGNTASCTLFLQTSPGGQFRPITVGLSSYVTASDGMGLVTITSGGAAQLLFNGVTWDRERANLDNITLVASAAYTTTQTTADQTNYSSRGVIVVLDMTTAGTGSVTLEIDGKDPVSGKYYAILTGAAVVSNSTNVYTVYPGNTATANVSASTVLPRTWRVKVTANNANSATYSVGAMMIR